MTKREVSYSYLLELKEDYEEKMRSTSWEWMKPILQELIYALDYKIHNIREQELCTHFQGEKILASISRMTNSNS